MKFAASSVLFLLASVIGFGCAATSSPESEPVGIDEAALQGGCRVVCPKCHPGEVCPKYACILDCNGGTPCGDATCHHGDVCCNESCGICTPPGGVCIQEVCGPIGECATDADCRLEADYCTGCDCSALATGESLPVCDGPGVKCFADPCQDHAAACLGGQCVVQ